MKYTLTIEATDIVTPAPCMISTAKATRVDSIHEGKPLRVNASEIGFNDQNQLVVKAKAGDDSPMDITIKPVPGLKLTFQP